MSACPSREELEQSLSGQLDATAEEVLSRHVETCCACQQSLEHLVSRSSLPGLSRHQTPGHLPDADPFLDRLKSNPPAPQELPPDGLPRAWSPSAEGTRRTHGNGADLLPHLPGYEILEEIGRGGMGVVYKARQIALNRIVAVKAILAGSFATTQERARFQMEAESAAALQHPNIVQVHEVGQYEGNPYFSMEFLGGGTLQDHSTGSPQRPRQAAFLIETLARAVQHAHEQGIVHRDLKPANVLMSGDGQRSGLGSNARQTPCPKIADFGLAKVLHGAMRQTRTGDVLGTPDYMAPEQAGRAGQPIGPPSDIYALGAMLYELLTGRTPFAGATPFETIRQVLHEEPLPLGRLQPGVPRDLCIIAHKCLEKEPARRYASARDLADDLHRFLEDQPIAGRPRSLFYRWQKLARRHKGLIGTVLAVGAALVAGTIAALTFAMREAHQRQLADTNASESRAQARAADEARRQALRQVYKAEMASSLTALTLGKYREAEEHLDATPADLRGFEWQYVHTSLLNQRVVPTPFAESHNLFRVFFPAVPYVITREAGRVRMFDLLTGARLQEWDDDIPVLINGELHLVRHEEGEPIAVVNAAGRVCQVGPVLAPGFEDVVMSPDGTWVATWRKHDADARRLVVQEMGPGKRAWEFIGSIWPRLTFSPDGSRIAGIIAENTIGLWTTATGELLLLQGQPFSVSCVAFSPDGKELASSSTDGMVRQWDIRTGKLLQMRKGHSGMVQSVAYSPEGAWLVSGGDDRTLRFWPTAGGDALVHYPECDVVREIGFSKDGKTMGILDMQDHIYLRPAPRQTEALVLDGHKSFVYPVALSPNGLWVASGGWDNAVRLWDARTGEAIAAQFVDAYVMALAFTPDNRRIIAWDGSGQIWQWNLLLGTRQRIWPGSHLHAGLSYTLAISPDGRWLAWGDERLIRKWDLMEGREGPVLSTPVGKIRHTAFSPDGRRIALTHDDGLALLEADTGQLVWLATSEAARSLAVNRDGTRLAVGGADRRVRIWDAETGTLMQTLPEYSGDPFAVVFHPDGTRIFCAGRDPGIHVWDVRTGDHLARLEGHTSYVFSLAISADGRTLVSGSGDQTVRFWDTQPAAERARASEELNALKPEAEESIARWLEETHNSLQAAARIGDLRAPSTSRERAFWNELVRKMHRR